MKNIYIIGDVHGCYKTLLALINKLPNKESKICFVGDLMDRGIHSKDVIELLINNKYDCVKGNHEVYFEEMLTDILNTNNLSFTIKKWLLEDGIGSEETLKSYGISPKTICLKEPTIEILKKHLDFIKKLPYFMEYRDLKTLNNRYLVVSHSHVSNTWENKDTKNEIFIKNILYGRWQDFDNKDIFNVYGHTPVINIDKNEYRANIDLGCVYKNAPASNKLCALEFPSMEIIIQENIE